jgi:hypothetical protein
MLAVCIFSLRKGDFSDFIPDCSKMAYALLIKLNTFLVIFTDRNKIMKKNIGIAN